MSRTSSTATQPDRRPVGRAGDSTTTGDERAFEWAALVPVVFHPLKVAIIEALVWIGVPMSATDLDKALDNRFGLGNVSYHLRELAKAGVVKQARTRRVRGAVERYFRLSDQMLTLPPARPEAA